MIHRFFSLFVLVLLGCSGGILSAHASDDRYKSVVQIQSYKYDAFVGSYTLQSQGSAVIIGEKKLITNAHVVLDENDKPLGYYEACETQSFTAVPTCFTVADLIQYDAEKDLALLQVEKSFSPNLVAGFSTNPIKLGSSVTIYGYPGIGGATITSTTGKIAGAENNIYKLDATIDSGNSGGGAFDDSGKLIGIPYAIRAENGLIGYMIPVTTVTQFLSGKTQDIEKYSQSTQKFRSYIAKQKKLKSSTNTLSTIGYTLDRPSKYGFRVKNTIISSDDTLSMVQLQSTDKRVNVYYACIGLTGNETLADAQVRSVRDSLEGYGSTKIETGTLGKNSTYSTIHMTSYTASDKSGILYVLPRQHTPCYAMIYYKNSSGDKKNIEKAKSMVTEGTKWKIVDKKTVFDDPLVTTSSQTLPENIRIHKSIDTSGEVTFTFWFTQANKNIISENLYFDSVESVREFFTRFDYSFAGKEYSWSAFEKVYAKYNDENMRDTTYTTKNGKKFIMTVESYEGNKYVSILYPFRTQAGGYKMLRLSRTTLINGSDQDVNAIRDFFQSLSLPGTAPFN